MQVIVSAHSTSVSHNIVGLENTNVCYFDPCYTPRRRISSVKVSSKFCTVQMRKLLITWHPLSIFISFPNTEDLYVTECLHGRGSFVKSLQSLRLDDLSKPPRWKWNLRSSGILRSVEWWFRNEVSKKLIGPFLQVIAVRKFWPLKMGQIGCSETSAWNYHSRLRKIPK